MEEQKLVAYYVSRRAVKLYCHRVACFAPLPCVEFHLQDEGPADIDSTMKPLLESPGVVGYFIVNEAGECHAHGLRLSASQPPQVQLRPSLAV